MKYTKETFAQELNDLLSNVGIEHKRIAAWAYETHLRNLESIDPSVSEWLIQLGAMDMGKEFEFSRNEIASLIATARRK